MLGEVSDILNKSFEMGTFLETPKKSLIIFKMRNKKESQKRLSAEGRKIPQSEPKGILITMRIQNRFYSLLHNLCNLFAACVCVSCINSFFSLVRCFVSVYTFVSRHICFSLYEWKLLVYNLHFIKAMWNGNGRFWNLLL